MRKTSWFMIAFLALSASPALAQGPFARTEVGGHVGTDVTNGPFEDWRVGVHGMARFEVLPVAVYGAVSFYVPDDVGDNVSRGGRQMWLSAVAFPFGRVWYLGTGVTHIRATVSTTVEDVTASVSASDVFHIVQTGLSLPIRRVSLFGELQLLNVLASNNGVVEFIFAGASLSL